MSGCNANYSGAAFEQQVEYDLVCSIPNLRVVDYKEVKNNFEIGDVRKFFAGHNILIRGMKRPRLNQNRKVATLEFYYCKTDTFIECKYQSVPGTASQKIPYAMIDGALNSDDGATTLFVLGGDKLTGGQDEPFYNYVCGRSQMLRYVYRNDASWVKQVGWV